MALSKDIELDSGAIINYVKISRLDLDVDRKTLRLQLGYYLSKEKRDSGKDPVCYIPFQFTGEDFDFDYSQPLHEQVYNKLKLQTKYKNSVDV